MSTYLASLRTGLYRALEQDSSVYLLGEDLLDPYGGAFRVSQGLSTAFPDRVITTPISEAGFTGVATGMALRGMRPIVEIMFGDFVTLCFDQLLNHCTKFFNLYQIDVPLVVRTPMGGGRGYGATHSQSLEKHLLGVPGLRVLAPSQFHDPGQMLQTAITETRGPILFIEHKMLYPELLLAELPGFQIRLADTESGAPTAIVANYHNAQPDVTVITYGGSCRQLLQVMGTLQHEEINILAAIPSSLDPLPLATLSECASHGGRVLIVEEGMEGFGWGSEVARRLYETTWSRLDQPIRCLASTPGAIPCVKSSEQAMLVNADRIEEAILGMLS